MHSALPIQPATGGNVALFIPRSMRGRLHRHCHRHRRRLESSRRSDEEDRLRREVGEEVKRGGERRKVGEWDGRAPSCTPFRGTSASPPSRPSYSDASSFFTLTLFARFLFFSAHVRLFPPSLSRSRTNPEVAGLEMLRLRAYTHRRLREEKRDSHLVFRKRIVLSFLEFRRLVYFAARNHHLCILFVAGLTDKIAPLLSNNIPVQSCRDPSTMRKHGNPIINDIRAEGVACSTCLGRTCYLFFEGLSK